jgi:hypothetical protein
MPLQVADFCTPRGTCGPCLVAEIQRADGAVLQRWSESGSGPFRVTWDGTAISGDAVAAGEYLGVFALMVRDEMVACIRQPLLLEH